MEVSNAGYFLFNGFNVCQICDDGGCNDGSGAGGME